MASQDDINSTLFRSTLPRGERPAKAQYQGYTSEVSIHAPARGATTLHNWLMRH